MSRRLSWTLSFLAGLSLLALGGAVAGPSPAALRQAQGGGLDRSSPPIPAATPIVVEFAVVTNTAFQGYPDISGNVVVWADDRSGNADIYGRNLATGAEFAVVTNTANQWEPAISGNLVVWEDWREGSADILGRNLTTGAEFVVVSDTAQQWSPAISGNLVVWEDLRNWNSDIYGRNLATGAEFAVVTHTAEQGRSAISGSIVVWEDNRSGNWDIYGRNLATGAEFAVVTNTASQTRPAISSNIVVWEDQRHGNDDIYGKDLATGREFAVVTHTAAQSRPAISGSIVVWGDSRDLRGDIYGENLATGEEFAVAARPQTQGFPAISGNIVVWGDLRNGNDDIYGARLQWLGTPTPTPTRTATPTPTRTATPTPTRTPTPVPLQVRDVRANPNPFNPNTGTTISYTLSRPANATLIVFDGELGLVRAMGPVARPGGPGAFLWDGRNQAGQVISSGLYIPIVVAGAGAEVAFGNTLAIADNGLAPVITGVVANPPNIIPPGGTTVSYQVSKGSVQVLLVLNVQGNEVRRIIAGYRRGGPVSIFWDGRNQVGSYVPDGSYILVPVAVDLLGRVGFNFTFVRVGNVAAVFPGEAERVAAAWVEAHRDELSGLVMKALGPGLAGSDEARSTD